MKHRRFVILFGLCLCSLLLSSSCYPPDEWTSSALTSVRKKQLTAYFSDYPEIGLKLGANFGIDLSEARTYVEYRTVDGAPFSGHLEFNSVPSVKDPSFHGMIVVEHYQNKSIRQLSGKYHFYCSIDKNTKEYFVSLSEDFTVSTRSAGHFQVKLNNHYKGSYATWDPTNPPKGTWVDKSYDQLASMYFIGTLDPPNRLCDVFSVPEEVGL